MRKPWTNIEIKILKALYPDTQGIEIASLLKCSLCRIYNRANKMGLRKSLEFKESELSGRITKLLILGAEFRFQKDQTPFNKGLTWDEYMSPEKQQESFKTTFQKGHLPHNTKSDGEISLRVDSRGYQYKHIRTSVGVWKHLHVHNWEKENGPVPEGFIVVFKSADKMNCEVSNLELITREENMVRNSIQRYPADLQLAMKSLKKLNYQINDKKQDIRSQGSPI